MKNKLMYLMLETYQNVQIITIGTKEHCYNATNKITSSLPSRPEGSRCKSILRIGTKEDFEKIQLECKGSLYLFSHGSIASMVQSDSQRFHNFDDTVDAKEHLQMIQNILNLNTNK
jgi:hypothetical protein